jgi:hypothetical protein
VASRVRALRTILQAANGLLGCWVVGLLSKNAGICDIQIEI